MIYLISEAGITKEFYNNNELSYYLKGFLKVVEIKEPRTNTLRIAYDFFVGNYYTDKSRRFLNHTYSLSDVIKNPKWYQKELLKDLEVIVISKLGYKIIRG